MPDETSGDDALCASLREVGCADGIAAVRRLSGGVIADAWLISWADGTSAVGKIVNGAVPDLFRIEADGLAALRGTGHLATPDVLAVTDRLLLLEALAPRDDSAGSWEAFARDMAGAHCAVVSDRFGWAADGWLGRLRQVNTWSADGHKFFAEHRLLRYLTEPPTPSRPWTATGHRRAVERLCARLPELIHAHARPPRPTATCGPAIWSASRAAGSSNRLTRPFSYTWAEVDLSMLWCNPRPPASDRFFAVYQELNPSPPGWAERMPVLHLRELLSSIAHFGPAASYDLGRVRDTLGPFYTRDDLERAYQVTGGPGLRSYPSVPVRCRTLRCAAGVRAAGQAQQLVCAVGGEKCPGSGVGVAVDVGLGRQFGIAAEHYPVERGRHDQPVELLGGQPRVL